MLLHESEVSIPCSCTNPTTPSSSTVNCELFMKLKYQTILSVIAVQQSISRLSAAAMFCLTYKASYFLAFQELAWPVRSNSLAQTLSKFTLGRSATRNPWPAIASIGSLALASQLRPDGHIKLLIFVWRRNPCVAKPFKGIQMI